MAVILLVPCRDEKVFVNDGIEMFFDGFATENWCHDASRKSAVRPLAYCSFNRATVLMSNLLPEHSARQRWNWASSSPSSPSMSMRRC